MRRLHCIFALLLLVPGCDKAQEHSSTATVTSGNQTDAPAPVATKTLSGKFPVVQGTHQLTKKWRARIPQPLNSRVEEGNLVLWRPGLTFFVASWDNEKGESREERLKWIRSDASPKAFDSRVERDGGLIRFSYRLDESPDDDRKPALYAFVIAEHGHVQVAAYFDQKQDLAIAEEFVRGLSDDKLDAASP
jgi:hypothetical protein